MSQLKPGEELRFSEYIYCGPTSQDISDLIEFSVDELIEKEQASIAEEKKIYAQMCDLNSKWIEQARETIRIRKAKQFLFIPDVKHTSNQWGLDQNGWHEISNKVYRMTYRIYEGTTDRFHKNPRTAYWDLTWSVMFNTPSNPDNGAYRRQIAGQSDKRFFDKAVMEKYLQGRIDAYRNLFTEVSPQIPKEHEKCFCVYNRLLPGYSVENPDALKPDETKVDELLAFLDDGDIGGAPPAPQPEPEPETPSPQAIWEKHRKQRTGAGQRKRTPVR